MEKNNFGIYNINIKKSNQIKKEEPNKKKKKCKTLRELEQQIYYK